MSTHSLRFSPEDTAPQEVTLLNASSSRYEGDWPSIPHSHAFTELFYVRDGRGEFLLEDKIYPISKDDLIIVNPHINHTEISKGTPPLSYFTVGVEGVCFSFNDQKEYRIFNCRKKEADLLFYFNSLFQELDKLIQAMEEPEVSLEDSFQMYHQGIDMLKACNDKMDKIEKQMLVLDSEGETHEFES